MEVQFIINYKANQLNEETNNSLTFFLKKNVNYSIMLANLASGLSTYTQTVTIQNEHIKS